jgi:hypothetical protein
VTRLRAGLLEGQGRKLLASPPRPDRLWGPSSLLSNGYRSFSAAVKRPGREADHSLPSSAEVKNARSYNMFMACLPLSVSHVSLWCTVHSILHNNLWAFCTFSVPTNSMSIQRKRSVPRIEIGLSWRVSREVAVFWYGDARCAVKQKS